MSLVGTRPPTLDEWEQYKPHHRANLISITATACIVDIYADRFVRFLNVLLHQFG